MSAARLHPQVAALLRPGAVFGDEGTAGGPYADPDIEALRADYAATADRLGGNPEEVAFVTDLEIARDPGDPGAGVVVARIYQPLALADGPPGAVVWCHGGGWVVGDLQGIDRVCRSLCARSGHVVLSVDYRLAPEHRFPAALDDCWTVVRGAASAAGAETLGVEPDRVVVGGDSAGGNLAAACARRARDEGLPVRGQLLVYPALDPARSSPSHVEFADGPLLTGAEMDLVWSAYSGIPAPELADRASDPELAPSRATDLAGLPPAHVAVAEVDPLRDEGLDYAARLEAAGVPVTTATHAGMGHGFIRWAGVCDEANVLLDALAASARRFLA